MPDQSNAIPGSEPPLMLAEAMASLRAGEVSSVALIESCLRRIERVEPAIHACVTVMADTALELARAVDAARRSGEPSAANGPLSGMPLGIKDLIQTRGVH